VAAACRTLQALPEAQEVVVVGMDMELPEILQLPLLLKEMLAGTVAEHVDMLAITMEVVEAVRVLSALVVSTPKAAMVEVDLLRQSRAPLLIMQAAAEVAQTKKEETL
jgi:hypothetical protein